MPRYISSMIVSKSNRKSLIIIALFFVAMQYLISISPFGVQAVKSAAPGVTILDMQFNYSPAEAHRTLLNLQAAGRAAYFCMLLIDYVFILSYMLFFMVGLTLLARFFFPNIRLYRYVWIVPFAGGMFDVLENCCFLIQLRAIPNALPAFATISNVFSLAKFFTVGTGELALGIGGVVWLLVILVRQMKKDWRNTLKK
jgi:hypothetical protein